MAGRPKRRARLEAEAAARAAAEAEDKKPQGINVPPAALDAPAPPPPPPPQPQGGAPNAREQAEIIERLAADPVLFVESMLGATPQKWQAEALLAIANNDRVAIRSGHGVGKALAHGEPVLTPLGWRPIETLQVGDEVIAGDGTPTPVVGVFPQGERELFRVTLDDGCSVLADADHQWFTVSRSERKHGKPGRVRTTREIMDSLTFRNGPRSGLNHQIPVVDAVQHPTAVLPVEPYLLGCWLGDGDAAGRVTGQEAQFGVLAAAGAAMGGEARDARRPNVITRALLGIRPGLRVLGLYGCRAHEKRIPEVYLRADVSQRTALLQGLLDTDGTVGKNNAIVFDVTAPGLADGVAELVRSLGGIARRGAKFGFYRGKQCRKVHRVYITLPAGVSPFRLPSKAARYRPHWAHKNAQRTRRRFIAAVEPAGQGLATCIAVQHPSHLFVTRDHIVTHNTAFLSWLVLWWLLTRLPTKVVCTANTAHQLSDVLWSEIGKWHRKLPEGMRRLLEIKSDKIELAGVPDSFAVARTSRREQPEALQGFHSENLLFVIDEASGVPDIVFEVGQGALSTEGAKVVMCGNPTRAQGYFYDAFTKSADRWWTRRVSCHDAETVDKGFLADMAAQYGDGSNQYRVRVLGEFPAGDDDTLIPRHIITAARDRPVAKSETAPVVWGLDVARFGDDSSALAKRRGNALMEPVRVWRGKDLMETCGLIKLEYDAAGQHRPAEILVDVIGLGAGVVDRLREMGLPVRGVNVAELPAVDGNRFQRLRDELWWKAREWFEARDCTIPDDEGLIDELCGPLYSLTSSGKISVEPKAQMKRRIGRSPDKADAFCLTFAGVAAMASGSGGVAFRWSQPIRRGVKGIV